MITVDGVSVPRALITELAHYLLYCNEGQTARTLLAGLASGDPSITLSDEDRHVVHGALASSGDGLRRLRDALIGKTPSATAEVEAGPHRADTV